MSTLATYSGKACSNQKTDIRDQGKWSPPRISESQAMEQAAGMCDRFNRIFMRTLRGLRDLRRYSPTVIVQNAEQVNVGQQQVNVANGADAGPRRHRGKCRPSDKDPRKVRVVPKPQGGLIECPQALT
jgi:hypothetical protein